MWAPLAVVLVVAVRRVNGGDEVQGSQQGVGAVAPAGAAQGSEDGAALAGGQKERERVGQVGGMRRGRRVGRGGRHAAALSVSVAMAAVWA